MGLDISHDAWHGAYGSFHRFRCGIAKHVGIPLPLMEGFFYSAGMPWSERVSVGERPISTLQQYVDATLPHLPIGWKVLEGHPLLEFLNHSDCDGEIAPSLLPGIADSLEELTPALLSDPELNDAGHLEWERCLKDFISGCRAAAAADQPLEFA